MTPLLFLVENAPTIPSQNWLDIDTLFTAAGASIVIYSITSVLQGIIPKFPAKIVALVLALGLCFAAIPLRHQPWSAANVILAIVNSFITYMAAVGVNNVVTAALPTKTEMKLATPEGTHRWWS